MLVSAHSSVPKPKAKGERDRSKHDATPAPQPDRRLRTEMMRPGARRGGGMEEEEEDRKPVIKPGVHVTLRVQDTEGRAVERTVRRTQKLQVLMDAYYASVPDVSYGSGRFLYDGGRLSGAQTPAELEMEEGDEIDFFTELLGGGAAGGRAGVAAAAAASERALLA